MPVTKSGQGLKIKGGCQPASPCVVLPEREPDLQIGKLSSGGKAADGFENCFSEGPVLCIFPPINFFLS